MDQTKRRASGGLPPRTGPPGLDEPILQLTDSDALRLRDLYAGTLVFGVTGSGKSSAIGAALASGLLRRDLRIGGLVMCVKSDEAATWRGWCRTAGREADLRVFAADQPYRLNVLREAYEQGGVRGGGSASGVVDLLLQLNEVRDRASGGSGGDQRFWIESAKYLLTNAVALLALAQEPLSFDNLARVIQAAPQSPEEVTDPEWGKRSYVSRLADRVAERQDLTPVQRRDAALSIEYWLSEHGRTEARTRANIVSTAASLLWPFRTGVIAELVGTDSNIGPADILAGKIVVVDLPLKQYSTEVGLFIQTCWKVLTQRAVEAAAGDPKLNPNGTFIYADEGHYFLTSADELFQSTARGSRCASVLLTQGVHSVRSRFAGPGGPSAAECLLNNYTNRIVACADADTAKWAADAVGETWQTVSNVSASLAGNGGMSSGTVDSRRYLIEPAQVTRLQKGGPGGVVEALVFRTGRPFQATGTNHLLTAFRQEHASQPAGGHPS